MKKVAFKKQVVGSAEDTNNIAISGNSGFCNPDVATVRSVLYYTWRLAWERKKKLTDRSALQYYDDVRKRAYKLEIENEPDFRYYDTYSLTRNDLMKEYRMEVFYGRSLVAHSG